jgi:hypothetical protein
LTILPTTIGEPTRLVIWLSRVLAISPATALPTLPSNTVVADSSVFEIDPLTIGEPRKAAITLSRVTPKVPSTVVVPEKEVVTPSRVDVSVPVAPPPAASTSSNPPPGTPRTNPLLVSTAPGGK